MASNSDKNHKILSMIPDISLLKRKQPDMEKEICLELRRDPAWQKRELAYEIIRYQIDQDRKERLYRRIMSSVLCVVGIALFMANFPEIGLIILSAGLFEYVQKLSQQKSLVDEYKEVIKILKENKDSDDGRGDNQ